MKNKEPIGVDLVDNMPDYSKTLEENYKEDREKHRKVYGKNPPESEKMKELIKKDK